MRWAVLLLLLSACDKLFDINRIDSNANISAGWLYGSLDEIRIYQRALSSAELMTLLQ